MAQSVTRWFVADNTPALKSACENAVNPYVLQGLTTNPPTVVVGPTNDIPEGQLEYHRGWTTSEHAQTWIDGIDAIVNPLGITCLGKSIIVGL